MRCIQTTPFLHLYIIKMVSFCYNQMNFYNLYNNACYHEQFSTELRAYFEETEETSLQVTHEFQLSPNGDNVEQVVESLRVSTT